MPGSPELRGLPLLLGLCCQDTGDRRMAELTSSLSGGRAASRSPTTDHAAGVASGCQGSEGSFIKQGVPGLGSDLRRPRAKAHLSLGKARFFPHSRALCVLTLHVVFLSPHSCLVVMLCLLVWGLRAPCRGPVHHTTHNSVTGLTRDLLPSVNVSFLVM